MLLSLAPLQWGMVLHMFTSSADWKIGVCEREHALGHAVSGSSCVNEGEVTPLLSEHDGVVWNNCCTPVDTPNSAFITLL